MAKLHSHLRRGLKLDIMYGCEVSYCFLLTYPFHTTGLFLYPPENRISGGIKREEYHEMDYYFSRHCVISLPSENLWFSDVFRGYRSRTLT